MLRRRPDGEFEAEKGEEKLGLEEKGELSRNTLEEVKRLREVWGTQIDEVECLFISDTKAGAINEKPSQSGSYVAGKKMKNWSEA